jgi:hypothetical protein
LAVAKNVVDAMPLAQWDGFKLDYLISGRGVLWVDNINSEKSKETTVSSDANSHNNKIKIAHIRWQDFVMDNKPKMKDKIFFIS